MVVPQKRRRMTDHTGSLAPISPSPAALANSPSTSTEPWQSSSHFIVENPPILKVAAVFPRYLAQAIRKYQQSPGTPWVAAITMTFLDGSSFGNKLGSMMSLEIMKNKVERLADMLFGAEIESTDEHRYLILPTGLRVLSTSDLILRGCKRDVIAKVFGEDIANAIKASLAFKEEHDQGNPLTECVSMSISRLSNDGAVINLSLDEREGVRVKAKLYE
ncbi:hypothetical protein NCS56_01548200 [Fusarium sp. Ph1]|nr:hypothetical protein NCS56_01549300 [Fusarium sp. Ph1]KAI8648159.1 hypothetical protein NCS56_01548200 [Fusarium sp. Ph1]